MKFIIAVTLLALATPACSIATQQKSKLRGETKKSDLLDAGILPEDASTIEEALAEASVEDAPAGIKKVQAQGTLKSAEASSKPQPQVVAVASPKPVQFRASALKNAQAASDVILKNGKNMAPAEFESAISDLMKIGNLGLSKEELDATPFGESVNKIKGLIEDDMMVKVKTAHTTDQNELNKLMGVEEYSEDEHGLTQCKRTKDGQFDNAKPFKDSYDRESPDVKSCREAEAGIHSNKNECWEEEADKKTLSEVRCQEFAVVEKKYEDQAINTVIVHKSGEENAQTYLERISNTFCGKPGVAGEGGFGQEGFLDEFNIAKDACDNAVTDHATKKAACEALDSDLAAKTATCNNQQDSMDKASCDYALKIKDSIEEFGECFNSREEAFNIASSTVRENEADRKIEWVGLKRMQCLIGHLNDGKITDEQVMACRDEDHSESTEFFTIVYPSVPEKDVDEVPKLYPTTAEYKAANFATLPALAKGKEDANECTGLREISTVPAAGSPDTCECERLTMNGAYASGPIVKCVDCLDVRRSQEKNSCPDGTKIFSPRSRTDWETFLASAQPLRSPNFIIDITTVDASCTGCTNQQMNSEDTDVSMWNTRDGSAWWLRSTVFDGALPNGDNYESNCYLDLFNPSSEDDQITFSANKCEYHAKSYYCQLIEVETTPKAGSPDGCLCEKVELDGEYSAKVLMKCTGCLDVSGSYQENSCPRGTKLFAPASRTDWKTFLASAQPVRSPDFIIDVTRPQDGCGGCTEFAMNSEENAQATWGTADSSAWWLRAAPFTDPSEAGDYKANCYMNVKDFGAGNEDSVGFEAKGCNAHSDAYFCQIAFAPVAPAPPPPPPAPEVHSSADYAATFRETGCPNTNPGTEWWETQPDATALSDMNSYCVHAKEGTGSEAQIGHCCGEESCTPAACNQQAEILKAHSGDDYAATFALTGCPNPEPGSGWWQTQTDTTVLNDMLSYCNLAKAGTASEAQKNHCCGEGVDCAPENCQYQNTMAQA